MSIPSLRSVATATSAFLLIGPAYAYGAPTSTTSTAATQGENTPLDLPSTGTTSLDSSGGGSGGGSLVRTFVGLAIVIAVIYGVTWVLKQVKSSREERTRGNGLSTAAVVALGPGRSLHLIRAGRELMLVGVADHSVVPIRTYTEEEALRLGLDVPEDETPAARRTTGVSQFIDHLRERTAR